MTNLEAGAPERVCTPSEAGAGELLEPRDVPLGGIRAMSVRRTLPQRARSFIGAWCFLDHYGPDDVAATGGMRVPPHPHTGLQTVSWLFSGEIEHRDSLGTHCLVRPGELNLMTAGHGISHSEDSTPATTVLHGVQLWTVLPERDREVDPAFDHYVPPVTPLGGGEARVFLGSLAGSTSPVPTFSPLVGAELRLRPGATVTLAVDPAFEHGVLVDAGEVTVDDQDAPVHHLRYRAPGATALTLAARGDAEVRVLLIGGLPLGEKIVMWWNFIGRDHEEVLAAREQWQAEIASPAGGGPRFGRVDGHPHAPLPAPVIPGQRLKPRA
jgi:redox-sensitive bicupin YhaK (pirin superfamily)